MNIILSRTLWTALLLCGLSLNAAPEEPSASVNTPQPAAETNLTTVSSAETAKPVRPPIVIKAIKAHVVTVNVWDEKFSVDYEGKVHQFKMAEGGILFLKGKPTTLRSFGVGNEVQLEVLEQKNGRLDLLTASILPPSKVVKHQCVRNCEHCAQQLAEADAKAQAEKESRKLAKAEAKAKKQAEKDARKQAKADAKAQKNAGKDAREQNVAEAERQQDAQVKTDKEARKLAKAEAKAARAKAEAEAKAQKKADKEARKLAKAEAKAKKQAEEAAREQAKAEAKAQREAQKTAEKVSPVPAEPAGNRE